MGSALAVGKRIDLEILAFLVASWVAAPAVSFFLGRGVYRVIPQSKHLEIFIIAIMLYSAAVLGLNDVSNAASSLVEQGLGLFRRRFAAWRWWGCLLGVLG